MLGILMPISGSPDSWMGTVGGFRTGMAWRSPTTRKRCSIAGICGGCLAWSETFAGLSWRVTTISTWNAAKTLSGHFQLCFGRPGLQRAFPSFMSCWNALGGEFHIPGTPTRSSGRRSKGWRRAPSFRLIRLAALAMLMSTRSCTPIPLS